MPYFVTLIVIVPLSFLSLTFKVSNDAKSLNSTSFQVSASSSFKANFALPNLLSCPMSLSKTC